MRIPGIGRGNPLGGMASLGNIRFTGGLPDVRRAITTLPGFPAVATAVSIAARLRALANLDQIEAPAGERVSMLALGMFLFGIDTLAFDELQRRTDWRHAGTERFGAAPAWQFLGPGSDTITLPGSLIPAFAGDAGSIAQLRAMATTGDAWPLVESGGTVLGQYVIKAIDERRSMFLPGGAPRKIDFAIDLERVDG